MFRNIGQGHENDEFYRYKRESISVVYENSNGCQTKMVNIREIAAQCHVTEDFMTKRIQKMMGISIRNNVLSGKINNVAIDEIIDKIISKEILCKNCNLPEWSTTERICNACGFHDRGNENKLNMNSTSSVLVSSEIVTTISKSCDLENETCNMLHQLYNLRDGYRRNGRKTDAIDEQIDKLWKLDERGRPDQARKIHDRVSSFIDVRRSDD